MLNLPPIYQKTKSVYNAILTKYPRLKSWIVSPPFAAINWVVQPILILTAAFITNGIIMLICGYNPIVAYVAAVSSTFGSLSGLSETLVKSTPYLMTGLSVVIAFRCGIWNIGAEGQFLMGALAATLFGTEIARVLPNTSLIAIPCCFIIATVAGGIWGLIPAILKISRGVNEVISTIMLNYIAIYILGLMIDGGPLQETSKTGPQSNPIVLWAKLPRLFETFRLHPGIVIAVIMAIVLTYVLFRTTLGFQLRAVGEGADAAEAAGFSKQQNIIRVFCMSGALAALGGAIELMALAYRLTLNFSPGYGYTAIAVALLARLNPLITIAAALLFGALEEGSFAMEAEVGISRQVTWMMQAIILLFVIGFSAKRYFNKQLST